MGFMMSGTNRQIDLAFIGGSGLYALDELKDEEFVSVDTPFGSTSDDIALGTLGDIEVGFLPRHGRGHRLLPSEVPYAANIYALKALGTKVIISISAVGSLRQEIKPLQVVVPDQLIDWTKSRKNSYFGEGIVAHVSFADPFCPISRQVIVKACRTTDVAYHDGGTCIVIEGPQFSTKSESLLYRNWGADIIGMTALPEAKLAREAEICYSTVAMVTDYDCWHDEEAAVSAHMVVDNLRKNVETSQKLVKQIAENIQVEDSQCKCSTALETALLSERLESSPDSLERIHLLLSKYI